MTWPFRPYPWPRTPGFWDAAAVVDEAPTPADQVMAEAGGVWPFGDADVATEACVLDDLAALTSVHGPWDAASNLFNPVNEGDH